MSNHDHPDSEPTDDEEFRLSTRHLAECFAAAGVRIDMSTSLPHDRRIEHVVAASRTPMYVVDHDGLVVRANGAFADLVGRAVDDVVGRSTLELTPDTGIGSPDLARYPRPDGTVAWGSASVVTAELDGAWHDLDPDLDIGVATDVGREVVRVVDVTAQVEVIGRAVAARRELAAREARYRELVLPAPDPVFRLTADGVIIEQNDAANELFGLDDRAGDSIEEILPAPSRSRVREMIAAALIDGRSQRIDRQQLHVVGSDAERWFMIGVVPELTGEPGGSVHLVLGDVTSNVANEQRLTALALTDPLTGIPNRAAAQDRLGHAMKRLKRRQKSGVAVIAVDIDNFKSLNDVYGHAFGDAALIQFAQRATAAVREQDTVGRIGGDEFLIVVEDADSAEVARLAAHRIADELNPFNATVDGGPSVSVTASMGMAWTSEPVEVSALIAAADEHLMLAKRNGRGRLWFPDAVDVSPASGHVTRSEWLGELLEAIDDQQFVLHYQPLVDREDRLVAVEALVRWQHPTRGLVPPDSFVPLLIETGQMATVGTWVMETAIAQIAEWRRSRKPGLRLNINASAGEIGRVEYRRALQENVERAGLESGVVNVELTEQALSGSMVSDSALNELASFGVNLVLDDFGTGISSLAHLRTDSLSGVKIDRSFVSNTHDGDIDRRIVRGVTQLAHEVGVEVTAEGVETAEQSQWIRSIGCDYLQGFYFARPVHAAGIEALVDGRRSLANGSMETVPDE